MKTLSRFRAKSISGSGDIDRGHKKPPPPTPDLQGSKKPRLNRVKRAELFGTPEHDKIKKQKCVKQAELFGTPEHDKMKKQKCVKRAELFGSPEHDQTKKNKQQNYSNIYYWN